MKKIIDDIDVYYTVKNTVRNAIKVKSSDFIASVCPVSNIEQANNELTKIKAEFYDANHNCFAYKIGVRGDLYRYSDDGEPSGSAGKPIYFSIGKYNYTDILVVVTRFFGGTKLGVGGLVRAYSEAAESALELCIREPIYLTETFEIRCEYTDVSTIKRLIADLSIESTETYSEKVAFKAKILKSASDTFIDYIFSSTNGRITPVKI
ncbi:MAG: YigZ family protein [Desulfobulbaceae bacterium]|nr:YigZ family protein [Candidatus Kapabacteria bacterium]MBS3999108.1 YigZ family protein [Desulfobulbaceae bacterium]